MNKLLVSACLLGNPVRYDGKSKPQHHAGLAKLVAQDSVIGFCPEVAGGLPIPRPAAEIQAAQEYIASREAIASRYRNEYALYLESWTGSSVNQLAIVEPAVEPQYPMGNKRKLVLGVAGAAGLALALGAAASSRVNL